MRAKIMAGVMAALVVGYGVLIAAKGLGTMREGGVVGVLLGLALLVLPLLGVALVWREIRFGQATARLAAELEAEGGLPVDDLPRRPSGRVERSAADAFFERIRAEVERDPEDWRAWFRLALAYDAAGDRSRARSAARDAIARHEAQRLAGG